jgi:hypothetical protein
MRRVIGSLAVCVLVCLCFTGVVVLAQAGRGQPPQTQEQDAVGKASAVPQTPDEKQPPPAAPKAAKGKDVRKALGKKSMPKGVVENQAAAAGRATVVEAETAVFQKAVAQKRVVRNVQQNRAPLIQQFSNQARPLLRAELIFARKVCQLNQEELRRVNQDAQKMLDEVVTNLVDAQFQPRARVKVGGQMGGMPGGAGLARAVNNLDAQQLLEDGVARVMKKNLTASQWSLYETERQKRDENRKRMTIRYFIDAIDRELYLSPEQCEKLEGSLQSNWDRGWTIYLENHLYGNRFYPMTIDVLVIPILTEAQKKVWQGVQRVAMNWGFAGMLGGFANDTDGLEVELGEPVRAQANQNQRMFPAMKMQMAPAAADVNIGIERGTTVVTKTMKSGVAKKKGAAPAKEVPPNPEKKVEKTKD